MITILKMNSAKALSDPLKLPVKLQAKGRVELPCGRRSPQTHRPVSKKQMAEWQHRLSDYLKQRGLKQSDQRWQMVRVILDAGGHLSAQQLLERVHQEVPGMGAATVYRNIKMLCEAEILRETFIDPAGRPVYEIFEKTHHDHVVCLDCGSITEFSDPKLEEAQKRVTRKLGFKEVYHRHVIYAHCTIRLKR